MPESGVKYTQTNAENKPPFIFGTLGNKKSQISGDFAKKEMPNANGGLVSAGGTMNKINNFMYMIAAVFVSNLVYFFGNTVAHAIIAASTCTYAFYQYRSVGTSGYYIYDRSACDSYCQKMYGVGVTGRLDVPSCYCSETVTATEIGPWMYVGIPYGTRLECEVAYKRDADAATFATETMYGAVSCAIDAYTGSSTAMAFDVNKGTYGKIISSCIGCPCAGGQPMYESCLGSQNSAPGSYMMRVSANPGATSAAGCYVVGNAYDPTGLYEYTDTDKCYYKPTATIPVPGGSVVPVPGGTVAPVGPSASLAK